MNDIGKKRFILNLENLEKEDEFSKIFIEKYKKELSKEISLDSDKLEFLINSSELIKKGKISSIEIMYIFLCLIEFIFSLFTEILDKKKLIEKGERINVYDMKKDFEKKGIKKDYYNKFGFFNLRKLRNYIAHFNIIYDFNKKEFFKKKGKNKLKKINFKSEYYSYYQNTICFIFNLIIFKIMNLQKILDQFKKKLNLESLNIDRENFVHKKKTIIKILEKNIKYMEEKIEDLK